MDKNLNVYILESHVSTIQVGGSANRIKQLVDDFGKLRSTNSHAAENEASNMLSFNITQFEVRTIIII